MNSSILEFLLAYCIHDSYRIVFCILIQICNIEKLIGRSFFVMSTLIIRISASGTNSRKHTPVKSQLLRA